MSRSPRGASLLEVAVTLAIIGILASVAMVNMEGVRLKQSERDALRQISADAIQARTQARTSQYPVRFAIHKSADGRKTTLRWEQLSCDNPSDTWGNSVCPSTACKTNACGVAGCTCVATGDPVNIPSTLDVSALDGLCWLARGAQPRQRDSGQDCRVDIAPPQGPLPIKETGGKVSHLLQVDGLTGAMRMVDCSVATSDPACK